MSGSRLGHQLFDNRSLKCESLLTSVYKTMITISNDAFQHVCLEENLLEL